MTEPFSGVRRGRERDAYDNWVREQEQAVLYPSVRYHGFSTYVRAHACNTVNMVFAAPTEEVRAALVATGYNIGNL